MRPGQAGGWRRRCLPLLLVSALAWPALAAAVPAQGQVQAPLGAKRVLVLASYGFGRPGMQEFIDVYAETLRQGGLPRERIAVEYLGLEHDGGAAGRARLGALLAERYRERPPDLVLAIQQPASEFLLQELPDLARAVPVISGSSGIDPRAIGAQYRMLLVPARPHVRRTLEQAMRLFPATERILVVVGASPADRKTRQEIAAVAAEIGLRARLEYTDGLTLDQMVGRAARNEPGTIVLAGLINEDASGAAASPYDMWLRIARGANAPSFVLFSPTVGQGTLGGAVQHTGRTALQTAQATLEILRGGRILPAGATVLPAEPTSFYDWRQLQRWGADPALLPADTVFVNKPVPLWREHPRAAAFAVAAMVLLSLCIAALLVQRRRLRLAESRYRVLVEHAPEAIVVYDVGLGRFVDANTKAERLFAASREELLRGGPERFYTDGQPDGLAPADSVPRNAERGLQGEEFSMVRSVRALDGRCFPCEVSVTALPSSSGKLLRGGYTDISERMRVEEELAHYRTQLEATVEQRTADLSRALEEAQAGSRARSAFLANMSHELRTPLNAIIGFSQTMAASAAMTDEEKDNLHLIHQAGQQLLAMINDILELARIGSGQVRLEPGPVSLDALLREIAQRLASAAARKGLRLHTSCPVLAPVVLDGNKLRQVLLNLVSNAIKFSDSGDIHLAVSAQAAEPGLVLRFSVTDSGIGIAPDDLRRIFDPFVQAATPGRQSGAGLGLSIARDYVRLLGGELGAQSVPGQGSRFAFSLRVADDGRPDPHEPPCMQAGAGGQPMPPSAEQLRRIPAQVRDRLHAALRQLDLHTARILVAQLHASHGAELAAGLAAMLGRHRYRELCALLADAPEGD